MDDRDSAHFAQATRQMMESGNYFQIRYQDETRNQKPPGINWLQAISVKTFSTPESKKVWPYRLPSVISGWLAVLLTFGFAKRFCGRLVAFIAAIGLASTVLLNMESHLATIDASLLCSIIIMQGSLWVVYEKVYSNKKVAWQWSALFFLSMSYGFLLKGVTPLVGFLTLITLSIVDRTKIYFKAIYWKSGILFLLLFSAAWLIAVSFAEHSNYLMEMIRHDLLPKLTGGHESHGAPFGTHLFLLVLTFWPISLFLWPTAVYTWETRKEPLTKFLLTWIIPTWVFFECMPTKLPQYILPLFPALVILVALAIVHETTKNTRTTRMLSLIWGIISLVFSCAFLTIALFLKIPINLFIIYITATLVITSLLGTVFMFKGNFKKAFAILTLGNALGFFPAYQWFLPQLTPVWSSQRIVETIEDTIPNKVNAEHPLFVMGYSEPSLVFLLGTHAITFSNPVNNTYASFQYALVDIVYGNMFIEATKHQGIFPTPIQTINAFNYNKGRWITLTLYQLQ